MANKILRDLKRLQSAPIGTGEINTMNRVKSFQGWGCRFILAACAIGGAIASTTNRALAQVTSDGTLGTQVGANGNTFNITDGTTVGTNLFHSFGSFSVPDGGSANFQNADTITNIFGRVTGGSTSNIQGTIRALGKANLFLINPSGIIFGPNARLDIGGSFVGTTANTIRFPNGGEFSLTSSVDPNNSVLAVNPSALFFNQTPAGAIVNQSTGDGLRVPDGRSLLLVGGDVRLDGGIIKAQGGRVDLGGLAAPGEVEIIGKTNLGLRFPEGVAKADISLANQAQITASITSGGSDEAGIVILRGNNVSIDNSQIYSQILPGGQGDPGGIGIEASSLSVANNARIASNSAGSGTAGDILIEVTGPVSVVNTSVIQSDVESGATNSNGGLVNITAGSLYLANQSGITTSSYSSGDAGDILIEVTGPVSLVNNSGIQSNLENGAINSNAGLIDIMAESLSLLSGSQLQTIVRGNENGQQPGQGNAGKVEINVRDTITIDGVGFVDGQPFSSAISSRVGSGASGKAGDIQISTRDLSLSNSGFIDTTLVGIGTAGSIFIEATDSVSLASGTQIRTAIEAGATQSGDATNPFAGNIFNVLSGRGGELTGTILISTGTLSLTDGSILNTSTLGNGNAGAVVVLARDDVSLRGGGIGSAVGSQATGNAGAILMSVGSLSIASTPNNHAGLTTETFEGGNGNAGLVYVKADKDISIRGGYTNTESGIASRVAQGSTNTSGAIILEARSLFLRGDEAKVTVDNQGSGLAGDIKVTMQEDIILRERGEITAIAKSGQGGNILLTSGDFLVLVSGSQVNTEAFNPNNPNANGGNIFVATKYIIAAPFNTNDVVANAVKGSGGNIFIFASRLYDIEKRPEVFPTNDISVSSEFGVDGIVTSTILNVDPTQGLNNLPANPIDPSTLIAETCAPRGSIADRPKNQFTVTGRNGLPPDPNAAFTGEAVVNELEPANQTEENSTDSPNSTNPESPAPAVKASPQDPEIVEAQGWVYGKNGDVIFTAQAPTITPNHPTLTPASTCNGF
jgi:filamentous hemagglutinin family protein